MDPEEKVKQIERDVLDIMEAKLARGEMDASRARAIARMVLEKLRPHMTLEQIYAIAPTLDDEFGELTAAILPILDENDEKIRAVVAQHAEALIKAGKIDEATKLLKNTLNK